MSRTAAALLAGLLTSALVLTSAPPARSALIWDRVTLSGARGGLTAVVVDPADPQIVWVAGGGSVWVSDDEGDTWSLAAHLGGSKRGQRRAAAGARDRDDGRDDDRDDRSRDSPGVDSDGNPIEGDDPTRQPEGRVVRFKSVREVAKRGGSRIHRLRIIKDLVYICADQGLYTVPRRARSMGGLREVRLGQTSSIYDVVASPSGKRIWVATPFGLLLGGVGYPAAPVFGALGSRNVRALLMTTDGLYVATARELWRQQGTGFVKLALSLGRAPIEDLVSDPKHKRQIVVVTSLKIHTVQRAPVQLLGTQALAGMRRAVRDRHGWLWVGGSNGAWFSVKEGGVFRPRHAGLPSRQVAAVAAPSGGAVRVWSVGQFGAARLVSEAQQVWNQRAKAMAHSREGMPTAWDVVQATYRTKRIDLETVGDTIALVRSSWLLPDLFVRYEHVVMRDEDRVFVPELDRFALDTVRVVPAQDTVQLQFVWDLSPLVFWAPEVWTPPSRERSDVPVSNLDTTPSMALRRWVHAAINERRRTNAKVIPLYNEWVNAKVAAGARLAADVKRAVRDELRLQHLEAELFAVTGGWFQLTPQQGSSSTNPHP